MDQAGNSIVLTFENKDEGDGEREFCFKTLEYNNKPAITLKLDEFEVEYVVQSDGTVKDFGFELEAGGKTVVTVDYDGEDGHSLVTILNSTEARRSRH